MRGTRQFSEHSQKMLQRYFVNEREVPDFEDLQDIFASLHSIVPNTIYIVDGLDALHQTDARRLLTYFRSLSANSGSKKTKSQILISSRDHIVGGTDVATFFPRIHRISTTENVMHDIHIYIEESIADKMVSKQLTDDDGLVNNMMDALLKESSGMYVKIFLFLFNSD